MKITGKNTAAGLLVAVLIAWSFSSAVEIPKRYPRKGSFEAKINGTHGKCEIISLNVPPSKNIFDTLYIRWTPSKTGRWSKFLCKIPAQMKIVIQENPCCGGLVIRPQYPGRVFFKLTGTDGSLIMGRYGATGIILKRDSLMEISEPGDIRYSPMSTPDYSVSVEVIDTSDRDEINELIFSSNNIRALVDFNGVQYENISPYMYKRCQIIYDPSYVWFDSGAVLIEVDARRKKGRLKRINPE